MSQPTLHAVTDNGIAHCLAHHKPYPHAGIGPRCRCLPLGEEMHDDRATPASSTVSDGRTEVAGAPQPVPSRQHLWVYASGSEAVTPLASPTRYHRAAGTGAHPQPEAVRGVPTSVAGLECSFAHWAYSKVGTDRGRLAPPLSPYLSTSLYVTMMPYRCITESLLSAKRSWGASYSLRHSTDTPVTEVEWTCGKVDTWSICLGYAVTKIVVKPREAAGAQPAETYYRRGSNHRIPRRHAEVLAPNVTSTHDKAQYGTKLRMRQAPPAGGLNVRRPVDDELMESTRLR